VALTKFARGCVEFFKV